jgi:ArsR family transcriptional regulator
MENKDVVLALSALAQETRLAIFRALVQSGPAGMSAGDIAKHLEVAPSLLTFHLKELIHARLIKQERSGRSLISSANFEIMNGLLAYLTENCCGGNPCSPVGSEVCPSEEKCC